MGYPGIPHIPVSRYMGYMHIPHIPVYGVYAYTPYTGIPGYGVSRDTPYPGYPQNGGTHYDPIWIVYMLDLTIIHVYLGYMPIPGVPQIGSKYPYLGYPIWAIMGAVIA